MKSLIVCMVVTSLVSSTILSEVSHGPAASGQVVARLSRYEVKPKFLAAFRKAVEDYVHHSLESEANVLSEAFHEQEDSTVLWLIERWINKTEIDQAGTRPAFKSIESLSRSSLKQPGKDDLCTRP